ncbi:hypothetical protein RHO15_04380 [Utexia brackfieldae]|uniref:hypothetical protein n=1 Tax=Utexia brackfieldae TaxID=3074108 RepID=UPI00370D4F43
MVVGFFIHPIISVIGLFILIFFVLLRPQRYFFNLNNNHKIEDVMEAPFANYVMNKEEIISCFLNKRFNRLIQLLDQPENQAYADHDFPIYTDDIAMLDEQERRYFDNIYLEVDEEINSPKYYCLLWQSQEYALDDEDDEIAISEVMILENHDYRALKNLIAPEKQKNNTTPSLIS